jgi:hypothetical protein
MIRLSINTSTLKCNVHSDFYAFSSLLASKTYKLQILDDPMFIDPPQSLLYILLNLCENENNQPVILHLNSLKLNSMHPFHKTFTPWKINTNIPIEKKH